MNNASVETRQQRRYSARQQRKGTAKPQKNAFYRVMAVTKTVADAVRAAGALPALAMKIAMMELAYKLGEYKSRGHGKNAPSYAHGRGSHGGSWRKAHQSGQECLRRAIGGWAHHKRYAGMTKIETLQFIAPQRVRLEDAIVTVLGLQAAA